MAGGVLARVRDTDLSRPTPCAGWDLQALIGHVVGQNHGFAQAVEAPDAPLAAFAARPPDPGGAAHGWRTSADRVAGAFAAAPLDREVLLVEISPDTRFPVATVVGFHLLDTVVHAWDLATSLGEAFRPDDELIAATLAQARQVPDGPARRRPAATFAPSLPLEGSDDWTDTLALLGRAAAAG